LTVFHTKQNGCEREGLPVTDTPREAKGKTANVVSMADAARDLARQKRQRNDPPPTEKRGVALPAKWTANALGLPNEDPCPVIPLGIQGEFCHLIDSDGQFRSLKPGDFSHAGIQKLFAAAPNYPQWMSPRWGKAKKKQDAEGNVTEIIPLESFKDDTVREIIFGACSRRGLFNPRDKLRGLGMWTLPGGQLIYHAGEELWTWDEHKGRPAPMETGLRGGQLYPRLPALPAPWSEAIKPDDNPSGRLIEIYRSWQWKRPVIDPLLMLGHNCVGYLGGALAWRPAILLLGDKGTGKSALQAGLQMLFGDAVFPTSNTTAAGIYQDMAHDNRLVAVDELEPGADTRKVDDLVALMRIAASGAFARRGGADGTPTSYQLRCAFLFSAINNPLRLAQDLSRVAILRLQPLPKERASAPPAIVDTAGRKLLALMMREWPRFEATCEAFKRALAAGGHDARGQDTYGTLLALAELALGGELQASMNIPSSEDSGWWAEHLSAESLPELEGALPNWRGCLDWLLSNPVDAWRGGSKQSVGQRLEALKDTEAGHAHLEQRYDLAQARRELADAGLGLLTIDELIARKAKASALSSTEAARVLGLWNDPAGPEPRLERGHVLVVPTGHPAVDKLFRDSQWGNGAYTEALRQCPEPGVILTDKDVNRASIGGVEKRCTLVVLNRYQRAPER
jgi:hypothetical protein